MSAKRTAFVVVSDDRELIEDALAVLAPARLVVVRSHGDRTQIRDTLDVCGVVADGPLAPTIHAELASRRSGCSPPTLLALEVAPSLELLTRAYRAGVKCTGKPLARVDLVRFRTECIADGTNLDAAERDRLERLASRARLTAAETEVFALACSGSRTRDLAEIRRVSANTIKAQLRSIVGKVDVSSLRVAIQLVRERRLSR